MPGKWKYRRARSTRNSDGRPPSMALSRYCGFPSDPETSRIPRAPRVRAHRAPTVCRRIVSALRARMFAGNPGNEDTRRRWSCGKRRVITLMPKQPASKPFSLTDRPAATRNPIAFVKSLEGEFDRRQALTLDHTIIENRLVRQQAEPSVTSGLQRQVGWLYQVEIVEVPQFRLDDAPRSEECVLRSSTCRHRVHAHHRRSITPSGHPAQTESGRTLHPEVVPPPAEGRLTRLLSPDNRLSALRVPETASEYGPRDVPSVWKLILNTPVELDA